MDKASPSIIITIATFQCWRCLLPKVAKREPCLLTLDKPLNTKCWIRLPMYLPTFVRLRLIFFFFFSFSLLSLCLISCPLYDILFPEIYIACEIKNYSTFSVLYHTRYRGVIMPGAGCSQLLYYSCKNNGLSTYIYIASCLGCTSRLLSSHTLKPLCKVLLPCHIPPTDGNGLRHRRTFYICYERCHICWSAWVRQTSCANLSCCVNCKRWVVLASLSSDVTYLSLNPTRLGRHEELALYIVSAELPKRVDRVTGFFLFG